MSCSSVLFAWDSFVCQQLFGVETWPVNGWRGRRKKERKAMEEDFFFFAHRVSFVHSLYISFQAFIAFEWWESLFLTEGRRRWPINNIIYCHQIENLTLASSNTKITLFMLKRNGWHLPTFHLAKKNSFTHSADWKLFYGSLYDFLELHCTIAPTKEKKKTGRPSALAWRRWPKS